MLGLVFVRKREIDSKDWNMHVWKIGDFGSIFYV